MMGILRKIQHRTAWGCRPARIGFNYLIGTTAHKLVRAVAGAAAGPITALYRGGLYTRLDRVGAAVRHGTAPGRPLQVSLCRTGRPAAGRPAGGRYAQSPPVPVWPPCARLEITDAHFTRMLVFA